LRLSQLILVGALALWPRPAFFLQGAEAPGVSNFHQVDDHVYRGGVPSKQGLESLKKLGVKTVVDLLPGAERSEKEKSRAESLGLRYVNVPMNALAAPTDDQIAQALSILWSGSEGPVFIHCRRGKDRTGTVVACYRISHDHWQKKKALGEARALGLSRVELGMQHYILRFEPLQSSNASR
jgi:tyrosine-protein phosphatase SIW14